jgi:hypothetical protein
MANLQRDFLLNNSMVTTGLPIRLLPAVALLALSGWVVAQAPAPARSPAQWVRCPGDFTAIWDGTAKVLRCRREVVSWVVTACVDKAFATYLARQGADACAPTEIPGVGTPPGIRGSKPVTCAASGYELMKDRTGERDRCEKTERIFALPLPAG